MYVSHSILSYTLLDDLEVSSTKFNLMLIELLNYLPDSWSLSLCLVVHGMPSKGLSPFKYALYRTRFLGFWEISNIVGKLTNLMNDYIYPNNLQLKELALGF